MILVWVSVQIRVWVSQVKSCGLVRQFGSVDSVKPSQLGQHGQTKSTQLTRSTQSTVRREERMHASKPSLGNDITKS
ncbi:hypothetical protein Hdeb2414_s0081g00780411 [Helianthus debilis subsp. tardiflorus]